MSINVTLPGVDKLQAMNVDVLVQPEIDDARDTFVARFLRGGRGLGAKRNTLSAETAPLSATVTSTLEFPRTTGRKWGEKNTAIAKAMAPNVLRKMVRNIQTRFATQAGS